jgi:hypothetical protein
VSLTSARVGCGAALVSVWLLSLPAGATLIGPTPYTGFAGSPFSGVSFVSFQLEDFEDSLLNVSGVAADAGFPLGPAFGLTDSVENAPDGCNPSGVGGAAHTCAGWSYYPAAMSVSFAFSVPRPTHAGVVWTDVGSGSLAGNVVFEAFDENGFSLGAIGPVSLGDGVTAAPSAAEDRFFGAVNAGGISRIVLTMPDSADWELDHLQFGIVPEPSTALLLGLGLACLRSAGRRRRR